MKGSGKMSEELKKKHSEAAKKAGCGKWMKGRPCKEITIENNKKRLNEKHPAWKGDEAGYRAKHIWIQTRLGKANACDVCGLSAIPAGKKRYFQWANLSREYKRELTDWKQMCIPCHVIYDKKYV